MPVQIQLRRDTSANWESENPTLALGEPGLETDTGRLKYGDGSTAWNSLAYAAAPNVTVRAITGNDTPTNADSGARLNVTDEAAIGLDDDDFDDGAWFVVRAETEDPVRIVVVGSATVSPDGPLVLVPYTAALCTHLTGGAWQVEGAFEE